MNKKFFLIFSIVFAFALYSCSRKSHPAKTNAAVISTSDSAAANIDSAAIAKKNIAKRKAKVVIPKVIVVNDDAAHKSVDGRYYYDMLGHRYWRNNKDGKYYLFNKSMYNDPDFKKPQ
jgi:hypothetical protein